MNTKLKRTLRNTAALGMISLIFSGSSHAVEYFLCAKEQNLLMPDGASVPLWGFALDNNNDLTDGCLADITVPGPALSVPATDSVLTIHVRNEIPAKPSDPNSPISLIIPGQTADMFPVKFTDGTGRERVRSFTTETNTGTTNTYTWNNMRPGTYVYQSGTHQAVQIQMGLYGSVVKNAVDEVPLGANAQAYAGIEYVTEKIVFYSEVDPVLHNEVASGAYGTTGMTSTIDYNPAYFLINGTDAPVTTITGLIAGQPNLLRFINMGLLAHAPVLHGTDWTIIAEDGHAYTYPKEQYSMLLPAGQTRDVLVNPVPTTPPGYFPMFDRMLHLTNRRLPTLPVPLGAETASVQLGDTTSSPGSLISQLKVGTDDDVDRVVDYMDNCSLVANPSQTDADQDGFGNRCDADLDNSGLVNNVDFMYFVRAYGSQDLVADFNEDGRVSNADISHFMSMYNQAPGPTGVNE